MPRKFLCVALWLAWISSAPGVTVAGGVVAHYRLDEGRGRLVRDARSGKARGKVVHAAWTETRLGPALEFDGQSAYVDCGQGKDLGLRQQVSLSAWILPTGAPAGEPVLLGEDPRYYALTYYKEHVYFYVAGGANHVRAPVPVGALRHVAGTFDGRTLRLYVDGGLQASKPLKGIDDIPSRQPLVIGGGNREGCFYKGLIQDARVYDHALLYDDVLELAASGQQEAAARMRAAADTLYDGVPSWRSTPANTAFLENLRSVSWGASSSGNLDEFNTPELAAKRAARIKQEGATVAFIHGRQNRLNHLRLNDELLQFHRRVAEACHAQGLRVFDHLDFTIFWQAAYPLIFRRPEWAQRDLRDGTPLRWCCFNKADFREHYARYLEALVRSGVDGFMLDEINYRASRYCGCEDCRLRFERETGFRLPEYWDESVIGNRDAPLWRLWQEWQKKVLVEFKLFLLGRIRKINPDAVILAYSTCIYRHQVRVLDMLEQSRACFIGAEGTNMTYPISYNLFAQMRILSSMARFYGRPAHGQYPSRSIEEQIFSSGFLSALTATHPWKWGASHLEWSRLDEAHARGEPLADVAVLLSPATRDGNMATAALHTREVFGWCQALGASGVQFEPLPGPYTRPEDLRKYKAVIVPHAVNMPKALADRVEEYVAQGGVAVVTGVAGRRDRLGFPLGADALHRKMKIRALTVADPVAYNFRSELFEGGRDREVLPEPGGLRAAAERFALPGACRFEAVLDEGAAHTVLARFDSGEPAILSLPSGKGRYIHVGFLPGRIVHQPRMYDRETWRPCMQPEVVALMNAIAREATGDTDRIFVRGDGLLSATYQKGNRVWVRMVNVAGIRSIPVGEKVGDVSPTYPDVGPVEILIRMPVASRAMLFSPDGDREVAFEVRRNGTEGSVLIPAGTFRRFAFVRLEKTP